MSYGVSSYGVRADARCDSYPLPELRDRGWQVLFDKQSGREYYYDRRYSRKAWGLAYTYFYTHTEGNVLFIGKNSDFVVFACFYTKHGGNVLFCTIFRVANPHETA